MIRCDVYVTVCEERGNPRSRSDDRVFSVFRRAQRGRESASDSVYVDVYYEACGADTTVISSVASRAESNYDMKSLT